MSEGYCSIQFFIDNLVLPWQTLSDEYRINIPIKALIGEVFLDLITYIATIGSFLSLFSLWDLILEKQAKHNISWYLFGYEKLTLTHFSINVINLFLRIFIKNGKIRKFRIFLVSYFLFSVFMRTNIYNLGIELFGHYSLALIAFPIFAIIGALISFPFDYAQMYIARRLFVGQNLQNWQVTKRTFLYFIFSLLLTLPLFIFSVALMFVAIALGASIDVSKELCEGIKSVEEAKSLGLISEEHFFLSLGCYAHIAENVEQISSRITWFSKPIDFLTMSLAISTASIIYINLMICFTLFAALVLRFTFWKFSASLNYLSQKSHVHDFPFTFLGAIFVFLFEICRLIVGAL
jgi:hypothetical protein